MKKSLLLFCVLGLAPVLNSVHANEVCDKNSKRLKADYSISITKHTTMGDITRTTNLSLWRMDNKVAHQYPETNITEEYTLVRNKFIKPVRYFDGHQRAIEYQPGETIHGKKETDFSYRYQLVSDTFLDSMTLVSSTGSGCEKTETYELKNSAGSFTLTWLVHQQLIASFEVESGKTHRTWTLTSTNYNADVNSFFAKRADYQATDYADIGDDHTDPFLTKMVTQGFIEAGASGFYNDKGHALEGEHSH